jgi:GT2 family glycosyltransferase
MTKPSMSAVIVAWNAGPSLAGCVDSLRESAREADARIEFVLVDNASYDSAVEKLELDRGDVVVRNQVNAGYGVAAAQGIARSTAPWILLVNPDLVVEPAFVRAMLDAADRAADDVATLVPELRFATRPDIVNCRGLTVDEIGVPAEIDAGSQTGATSAPSLPLVGGSSGCCLLRSDHIRSLGGPEPAFFAYLEDVDLALRLRRAGFGALFVPGASALHEGSATTGARSPLKAFLVARNRRLLFRLHGPWSVRARTWRTVTELGHAGYMSLATPIAPWSGRLHALAMHRYTSFLRRSRSSYDPVTSVPELAPRVRLRDTVRRKRRVTASSERDEVPIDEGARHG